MRQVVVKDNQLDLCARNASARKARKAVRHWHHWQRGTEVGVKFSQRRGDFPDILARGIAVFLESCITTATDQRLVD
jgi:hypothetical protein